MVKLIIFFRSPADTDAFEEHFASRHVPLIAAMPNVIRSAVSRAIGAPRGEAPYHLIHDVYFADMAALNFALNSTEGRAAGADLSLFARDLASLMFAEVWGEDPFEQLGADNSIGGGIGAMGSEPVPTGDETEAEQHQTSNVTEQTTDQVSTDDNKVPIDVSFLERSSESEEAVVAVAEAIAESPVSNLDSADATTTDMPDPEPELQHPPQPSLEEPPV